MIEKNIIDIKHIYMFFFLIMIKKHRIYLQRLKIYIVLQIRLNRI